MDWTILMCALFALAGLAGGYLLAVLRMRAAVIRQGNQPYPYYRLLAMLDGLR